MNIQAIRETVKAINPKWPLPVKFVGGGADGRVFETNDGRYMKFVMDYAPQEWKALKKLQGNFKFPRIKNGNHLNFKTMTNRVRDHFRALLNVNKFGEGLTIFIMGQVGGGNAMTLKQYIRKFPDANRMRIQNRVFDLIESMHIRGVSHGNLHSENILVTADSVGRLTGMWAIDFGRSKNIPLGKTEREHYNKLPVNQQFWTPTAFNSNKGAEIPVRNASRANVHMANIHYGKKFIRPRENIIKNRRLAVASEMKNYKSPRKTTSPRRSKSLSPRRSKSLTPRPKIASPLKLKRVGRLKVVN